MTNSAILEMLLAQYNALAFTHNYIIGFPYKGVVYFGFITAEKLDRFFALGVASRGRGYIIRFIPRNDQKLALLTLANMQPLMSEKYFNMLLSESKYNRGEVFEKAITERFNQTWEKDSVPFDKAGDIVIDGVPYQIKYASASLASEKTLQNRMAKGRA